MVDNAPAVLFSPMELDLSAKQFEFALVMKLTAGRPSLHDIKLHINHQWKLSMEPVVTLIDPRHVLIVPSNYDDMVLAQSHDSHIINTSMFRLFRWTRNFNYTKDSTIVSVWIKLPQLPLIYLNPSFRLEILWESF